MKRNKYTKYAYKLHTQQYTDYTKLRNEVRNQKQFQKLATAQMCFFGNTTGWQQLHHERNSKRLEVTNIMQHKGINKTEKII
jgi:hypothetical protein